MSLSHARDVLRTAVLEFLWDQWTDLGVAGTSGTGGTIVDPEALVIATLDVGRTDPRLFDEVLDWLALNGDLLDVTRLRHLTKRADLPQQRLARVVIDLMRQRGTGSKWAPLSDQWQTNEASAVYSPRALFLDATGADLPVFVEPDTFFASYGFDRPPLELRGMSERPQLRRPCLARLGARALVGIGVRAEVLLYLWTHTSAHGRLISARSDYSQRQVSEYLAGLAAAGYAERYQDGKLVQYRLVPSFNWQAAREPLYVDWAAGLSALGALRTGLAYASDADTDYEASVRTRSALEKLLSALPIEGLNLPLPKPDDFPGDSVLEHAEAVALMIGGAMREITGDVSAV